MNKRLVYAIRALGQDYSGVKNMPNPMTANNYDKIIGNVTVFVMSIAQHTMQDADIEIDVFNIIH